MRATCRAGPVECGESGVFPQECNPPIPLVALGQTPLIAPGPRGATVARMAFDEKDDEKEPRGLMNSVRKQNRGQQLVCNPGNWPFPKQPSAHLDATPARLQSASRAVIGRPPRQAQTVGVGVGGLCVPICPPRFSDLRRSKVPNASRNCRTERERFGLHESDTFSQPPSSQLHTHKTLHLALPSCRPLCRWRALRCKLEGQGAVDRGPGASPRCRCNPGQHGFPNPCRVWVCQGPTWDHPKVGPIGLRSG